MTSLTSKMRIYKLAQRPKWLGEEPATEEELLAMLQAVRGRGIEDLGRG